MFWKNDTCKIFFYIHLFGRWEQKWGKPASQNSNWSYLWVGSPVSCTEWASGESFVAMFDPIRWPPGSELFPRTLLILYGCSNQQVCRRKPVVLNWRFENYLLTYLFLLIFAPHSAPLLLFLNCNVVFSEDVPVALIVIARTGWTVDALKRYTCSLLWQDSGKHAVIYRCYSLMKMLSHLVKVDSSYRVPYMCQAWGFTCKFLHVFSQFILIPIPWGRSYYWPHITKRRRGRGRGKGGEGCSEGIQSWVCG